MAQWTCTKILIRELRCMINGRVGQKADGSKQEAEGSRQEADGSRRNFSFVISQFSFLIGCSIPLSMKNVS